MEFFSRLFNNLVEGSEFGYHPKCSNPPINHICFADDLFLLCLPNEASFKLVHKALQEFHKYSGLQPNGSKSKAYISGVSHQEKLHLCSILGFQIGDLPVKYLGVPLISTKLKSEDCKELIEKITNKVKSWTSKCLSYAGRLVLIKSVLFSIQVYWSIHFILPKKVTEAIEQILRRYLWSGSELRKWGSKVAWCEVCKPKNEGGLGIRKLDDWNKASMMRHIWALCTKSSSLWAEWCNINLLKGKCFWEVKIPSDCSWTWRKLLKLRELASTISKYKIGSGDSISLWFSNWHPQGPLIPRYGSRIAYDAGLPINAKVSQVINNGQWKWPYPCTWELKEIILEHPPGYLPNPEVADEFMWMASKSKTYNAATTWNSLREKSPKVIWHHLLWFPKHFPRHSFILWLAIKERLNTKDKLMAWGITTDPTCVLCGQEPETMNHLFFQCSFSAELKEIVLRKCSITKATQPWRNEVIWAAGKFNGKCLNSLLCKLAWAALVYHIWHERNARIFKGLSSSIATIIQDISYVIRTKLSQFPVSRDHDNSSLCTNWGIPM